MTNTDDARDALPRLVADVYELAGALRRRGDEIAGLAGQTQARWQVLSVVSEGDWTVPDAARRLGVTRQAVQRTADLLVDDRLARYEDNPAHRKSPLVRLTPRGRTTLERITTAARGWHETVAAGFSTAELHRTSNVLRSLLERIDGDVPT